MSRYAVTLSLALLVAGTQCALAQSYPARVIRLVVPSAPGGGSDIMGRTLAQKLSEAFGQQVVVDNRPGASGTIGMDRVAKSAPDGYTLGLTNTSLAINPSIFKKLPYDTMRDFAPISRIVEGPLLLTRHPSVPARSIKELIALAKAKPGVLTIASPGLGTLPHLATELFKITAGVDILQVIYQGTGGRAEMSVIAGELALIYAVSISMTPHIKAGKLRALGVSSSTRVAVFPDIPTIAETLPGYEAVSWFGVVAPAGTPRPIIDRLNQEIVRALRAPAIQERLSAEGMTAVGSAPEEFATYLRSLTQKWARVAQVAGIKPQ